MGFEFQPLLGINGRPHVPTQWQFCGHFKFQPLLERVAKIARKIVQWDFF